MEMAEMMAMRAALTIIRTSPHLFGRRLRLSMWLQRLMGGNDTEATGIEERSGEQTSHEMFVHISLNLRDKNGLL